MNTRCTRTFDSGVVAVVFFLSLMMVDAALGTTTIYLKDIDSGLTSPTGTYRWLDVADEVFKLDYQTDYDYTQATVEVQYDTFTGGLAGTLTATNLKPNFAYQLKVVGFAGTTSNETIGLAGRWWQEEWGGAAWVNGQNANDAAYSSRHNDLDSTSPTGFHYKFTGYLLFDYFITDKNGDAILDFVTNSSYHVLWKISQPRARTASDGPIKATTFDADDSPAYEDSGGDDYLPQTIEIYGEVERLPVGGVFLTPNQNFSAQIVLTEESFHGSGGALAGNWAGAMGASIGFVEREGMQLTLNGAPHVFVGTNFWYGINLAANTTGDRERLVRELDRFQSLGINNLRIMAGSEGPNSEPWRMVPALQTSPGTYDADILDGLDFLLHAMKVRDLRAVMVLTNFWHWSGGMAQYVNWNGGGAIPYPLPGVAGSWDTYQTYTSGFYLNPGAKTDYRNHIDFLVKHINPYTGLTYADDPSIMSWELANEPRGLSNAVSFNQWINDTALFIKSLDPNHLVTTGTEGNTPWPSGNGLDFRDNHDSPDIDYATVHIWPQNWGWYNPAAPDGTYLSPEGSVRTYLNSHLSDAVVLNKPLVLEEFGLARDGESYDPQSSTSWRDQFFTAMFEEIFNSASSGGPAVGDNVWAWAGEGRPLTTAGSYWSPGDPWIGDPPHEKQGWYSIYDSDATTLSVIFGHVSDMDALVCDAQLCDDGVFCNGVETCGGSGSCEAGTPVVCDDSVACTVDSCNEGTDSCDNVANDANCDNGFFCDGAETCDAGLGCQAGTAPGIDDGVACTDDSCDEATDAIVSTANNANCDDGLFCNGDETCDAVNDCQSGTPPDIDDGVACTVDSCDEVNDTIVNTPDNGSCDNSLAIEAEDTTIRTAGGPIGESWCLWSQGTLGEDVLISGPGTYEVVVRAYGTPLGGIWPLMALHVDGVNGEAVTVDSSVYMDYSFQVELDPGVHFIGVTFLNDAYNPGVEDRNLYVDRFVIISPPGIAKPELASKPELANALVIEAEDTTIRTVGGPSGEGWNLWSEGTLGEDVLISGPGTYEVVVRAYGSPLGGIWPLMALHVDGVNGETVTVDSSVYMDYSLQVELEPGVLFIGVSFLNDAYNPGVEDRNLYVDRFAIIAPPDIAKPELARALVIEAEDTTIQTVGGPSGESWCLWSEGTLGEDVLISGPGIYEVVVRAYGSPLGGIWPLMALHVDGVDGESVTVDSGVYADYLFQVELDPGIRFIGVSFLNDAWNPGVEDRNLYVDRFVIISPPGVDKPEL